MPGRALRLRCRQVIHFDKPAITLLTASAAAARRRSANAVTSTRRIDYQRRMIDASMLPSRRGDDFGIGQEVFLFALLKLRYAIITME